MAEKVRNLQSGQGLNAATGEYVDMIAAGIIDPAKVTRSALQNAASIAALFLTTEAVVADKPEKAAPAMPGGAAWAVTWTSEIADLSQFTSTNRRGAVPGPGTAPRGISATGALLAQPASRAAHVCVPTMPSTCR